MRITTETQRVYQASDHIDPFYRLFMNNLSLRPSCYDCSFKKECRCGDITIADFWRGEQILPGFGKEGDMSLVILNNEKARSFFENNEWNAKIENVSLEQALSGNSSYYHSVEKPMQRESLFANLDQIPFGSLCKGYAKPTKKQQIADFLEKVGLLSIILNIWRKK